ncbi:MAG TPA: 23S rRNA (pseudouridine(1915)-N(3))-methyltransferase RlmH [Gammaproteobacteria bacterium]|nr:23S rRNA (pseudouridine(1915)-N(3))-methyltransferase RlmH [Gammaproteobacteria bacterium]
MSNFRSRQVDIYSIGNPLAQWVSDGIKHYQQQSKKWINIQHTHLMKCHESPTHQWNKLQPKLNPRHAWIALDVTGKQQDSVKFKHSIHKILEQQSISFIIGGAYGLAEACIEKSTHVWSLSNLTFSHTLVPILLVEQTYRAMSMIHQHPYHKS